MPSVLVLHYAVAPSEPLAAALTISYNDSNLQGKSSATNQQNIYMLKSRKHSKIGRRLSGMDICVMIPASEEQEYLRLALKMRLTAEFTKRLLLFCHLIWLGKCLLPPYTIQTCGEWLPPLLLLLSVPWILVTAWPTFTLFTPASWYHTSVRLHSVLHTCTELLTWLGVRGTTFFCISVCKFRTFLWSVAEKLQKVEGTTVLQPQAGLHDGPREAGLPSLLQW